MMTWADKIETKAWQAGHSEGRQEEHRKNLATMRQLALRLITQRFGAPSRLIEDGIRQIESLKELANLAEKVAVVRSLDELGLNGAG